MFGIIRNGTFGAVGALTAVAVAGWSWAPDAQAVEAAPPTSEECEATFDPDTVTHGEEEEVEVTFSESIGTVEEVEADPESGLLVEWLNEGDVDEPTEGEIHVDATDAEAGTWDISFHGSTAECHGELTVERDD